MAKELKDLLKADLVKMIVKLEKKVKAIESQPKPKSNTKEVSGFKKKIAELEEVNRLLAIQQDDDSPVNVNMPATTPQPKEKKLTEMGEMELAQHMRLTTSRKIL